MTAADRPRSDARDLGRTYDARTLGQQRVRALRTLADVWRPDLRGQAAAGTWFSGLAGQRRS